MHSSALLRKMPSMFTLPRLRLAELLEQAKKMRPWPIHKGHLIVKADLQVNSSKKRTNEFIFISMRRVFVRFLEEVEDTKKTFEII